MNCFVLLALPPLSKVPDVYPWSVLVGMDNGAMGKELLYQCYSWSYE
jgi:hypothetical protein